jgi:Ca2+-binding EF-hand superfamily protein
MAQLKTKEDEALRAAPAVGVMAEDALEQPDAVAFVEAAKLKLARHMCAQAASAFELLDKDKDGKVQVAQLDRLLRVVEQGNSPEWLRSE